MDIRTHTGTPLYILILLVLVIGGCSSDGSDGDKENGSGRQSAQDGGEEDLERDVAKRADSYDEAPNEPLDADGTYTARVETTKGDFDIALLPKAGPIAAANFAFLVREGFYDGVVFHRILEDFVVQTGDPLGNGQGGPGYSIKDDPVKQPYLRGVVAMANAGPDTGGSQFFVVLSDEVELPPSYAVFGTVDDAGMKVVDEIAATPVRPDGSTGEPSVPDETVRVERITLDEPK